MKRTPIEYDAQSDTLQIYLSDAPIEESAELQPGLIVDYDAAGNIVGIELLDASEIVKSTPEPIALVNNHAYKRLLPLSTALKHLPPPHADVTDHLPQAVRAHEDQYVLEGNNVLCALKSPDAVTIHIVTQVGYPVVIKPILRDCLIWEKVQKAFTATKTVALCSYANRYQSRNTINCIGCSEIYSSICFQYFGIHNTSL